MHKELISGELNCIALGLVGQRRIYLELSSALLDHWGETQDPPTCSCHNLCKSDPVKENPHYALGPWELELALKSSPSAAADFSKEAESGPPGDSADCDRRAQRKEALPALQSFCALSFHFLLHKAPNVMAPTMLKAPTMPHTFTPVWPQWS